MALDRILSEEYGISATFFDEIDSTNAVAKRAAADGAAEWSCFLAKKQTCGRGRLGRSFFSPEGGLYMSVVLRPSLNSESALLITTAAAAAVNRALFSCFGRRSQIKWVNDIIMNGRKVCGILAESALMGDSPAFTVLGIGVNLYGKHENIPDELKNIMGFVCDEPCDDEKIAAFVAEVLKNFKEYYVNLECKPHLAFYRENMLLSDTAVVISPCHSTPVEILGLDDEFRLCVKTANGQERLSFGEVSIRL